MPAHYFVLQACIGEYAECFGVRENVDRID
jgi:hypothetical protein